VWCFVHGVLLGFVIFKVMYSIAHVIIKGFHIGFINFRVSVVGPIYRTLETFFFSTFLSCRSIITGNDLEIGI